MKNGYPNRTLLILAAIVATSAVVLVSAIRRRREAELQLATREHAATGAPKRATKPQIIRDESRIPAHATFSQFMRSHGINGVTIERIVEQVRSTYNLGEVRAAAEITLMKSAGGKLVGLRYQIDPERWLWIEREGRYFVAHIENVPVTIAVAGISGRVDDSLVQAVEDAGAHEQLAAKIASLFRWQIDFNTECKPGDTFKALIRKKLVDGHFVGYGRIMAAQYDNNGRLYQGILFHDSDGRTAYYTPSGEALQKAFLRSPLRFDARVTSRFSYHRFHPILHRYMPHLGIDFAAPVGSRVQAVASGRVVFAGWDGLAGRLVRLKHANGYETLYMHLSRILVHRGEAVRQGQIIALTGDTGLSTGPHLDFRIEHYGHFLNFFGMHLPPAHGVSAEERPEFVEVRQRLLSELASVPSAPGTERVALQQANPSGAF